MSLPASWTTVTVTGTFKNHDGTPASGWVTFAARQTVTISGQVVLPKTITGVLDGSGYLSVQVPSTTDPDLSATGWAYLVTEHMPNGRPPYLLEVPHTASTLDLASAPHATVGTVPQVTTGIYRETLAAPSGADLVGTNFGGTYL